MSMHILIVEDTVEEQVKARQAVEAAGHTCTVVSSLRYDEDTDTSDLCTTDKALQNADAVITDLHFFPDAAVMRNPRYSNHVRQLYGFSPVGRFYDEEEKVGQLPPVGLLVVIDAITAGKPVVVCTAGDHHGPQMSWIHDSYLQILNRRKAFGWNDRKDWTDAVKQLEERYNS